MPEKGCYYRVYEFMTRQLGLSGAKLQVYARIFHFSYEADSGGFFESRTSTAQFLGITTRAVIQVCNSLVKDGLVYEDGVRTNSKGKTTKIYRVTRGMADAAMERLSACEGISPEKISAEFFGASEEGRGEKPSHVSLNNLQTRKEGEKKPMKREGGSRFAKYG